MWKMRNEKKYQFTPTCVMLTNFLIHKFKVYKKYN